MRITADKKLMTEGWVPNNEELTQCVLLIQALRDPTRSDHKMALSVNSVFVNSIFLNVDKRSNSLSRD